MAAELARHAGIFGLCLVRHVQGAVKSTTKAMKKMTMKRVNSGSNAAQTAMKMASFAAPYVAISLGINQDFSQFFVLFLLSGFLVSCLLYSEEFLLDEWGIFIRKTAREDSNSKSVVSRFVSHNPRSSLCKACILP